MQNKGFTVADYAAAHERLGSNRAVAKEFGVNESTVRKTLNNYRRREGLDPGIKAALEETGLSLDNARFGYRRIKHEDGSFNTVMWRAPEPEQEDALERIRETLEGLSAAPVVPVPTHYNSDLCTVIPVADAHIGLLAWGAETGEDYDTQKAVDRLQSWVSQVVDASPASDTAVLLGLGDLLHADDTRNQTPASKHSLDVDTRHFKTLEMAIKVMATAVELAAAKHKRVIVRILRGNHDEHSHLAVLFALAERYRDDPRIEVQRDPSEFFAYEFGKVLIAAHHGDRAKAERMVLFMADQYPEMWGRTKHRFLFTGHLHHHKSQDIGGVQWEQLRAVTARDAYAVGHAYSGRAQLQAVTYHRTDGEVMRVKVNG
jgi:hypothetical protein